MPAPHNPIPDLPPGQQLAAPDKWPTVGERLPPEWDEPWQLTCVDADLREKHWTLAELMTWPGVGRKIDIHCVTRWSKLAVPFRGVLLRDVVQRMGGSRSARYASFVAHSARKHSTSLPLEHAMDVGTLLAWECEDRPLPVERGGPLRVVVPGCYFYKSLKWLRRIELLREDRLGYWEAEAGYHNRADVWQEQRYVAPGLSRLQTRELLEERDFSGRDLRSLRVAGHDLAGLAARAALLRDADFRRCNLRDADFRAANLSNAHFQEADLRGASFREADIEGADLSGADLRGADLHVLSWTGVSLCDAEGREARLDPVALNGLPGLDALTPDQLAFIDKRGYI